MYDRNELLNIREAYQLIGPRGISIAILEEDLKGFTEQFGVPLAWNEDKIDNGDNAKEPVQDCLVLYHPDHKNDYFNIVVEYEAPTKLAILRASIAGASANGISRPDATALIQGGKMALGNVAGTGDGASDPEACEAEKEYYADLFNIINALIGASEV